MDGSTDIKGRTERLAPWLPRSVGATWKALPDVKAVARTAAESRMYVPIKRCRHKEGVVAVGLWVGSAI